MINPDTDQIPVVTRIPNAAAVAERTPLSEDTTVLPIISAMGRQALRTEVHTGPLEAVSPIATNTTPEVTEHTYTSQELRDLYNGAQDRIQTRKFNRRFAETRSALARDVTRTKWETHNRIQQVRREMGAEVARIAVSQSVWYDDKSYDAFSFRPRAFYNADTSVDLNAAAIKAAVLEFHGADTISVPAVTAIDSRKSKKSSRKPNRVIEYPFKGSGPSIRLNQAA
jgi:hypothetical protein